MARKAKKKGFIPPAPKVLANLSDRAEAHFARGMEHYQQGRARFAVAEFSQAAGLVLDNPAYFYYLGLAHQQEGAGEKAVANMERAVRLAPGNYRYRYNLGIVYVLTGRLDEARRMAKEELKKDGAVARWIRLLALADLAGDDPRKAMESLAGLKDASPGEASSVLAAMGLLSVVTGGAETAASYLESACKSGDTGGEIFHALGDVYARLDRIDEASKAWDLAIEAWQKGSGSGRRAPLDSRKALGKAYILRGNRRAKAGDYRSAVSDWRKAEALDPNNLQLLQNTAIACERLEENEQALDYWSRVVNGWKKELKSKKTKGAARALSVAYFHLSRLHLEIGNEDEALRDLERAANFDPSNREARKELVREYTLAGRWSKALELAESLMKAQERDPEIMGYAARALEALGRRKEALEYWTQLFETNQSNSIFRKQYAYALARTAVHAISKEKDRAGAIAHAQRAIILVPDEVPLYGAMLAVYQIAGEDDKARETVQLLLARAGGKPGAYLTAGRYYLITGNKRQAAIHFNKGKELAPGDEEYRVEIGKTYLDLRKYAAAKRNFKEAVEIGKKNLEPLDFATMSTFIAEYWQEKERPAEALQYFKIALEAAPRNQEGLALAGHLRLSMALCYLDEDDFERAKTEIRFAIEFGRQTGQSDLVAEARDCLKETERTERSFKEFKEEFADE